jgi:hypothetical protein
MIRIFSAMAIANGMALLLSFTFGLISMWTGGLTDPGSNTFHVHFLCGLFASVATLLVHCMIFTYFLGTGRWVREVTLAYDMPDAPLYKTTRELKRKTFPPALFAMLATIATAAAGGGRQLHDWPYQLHLIGAIVAILINLWAYWVEIRSLLTNERVLTEVYAEVERVRAERGLPPSEEALRMEVHSK